MAGFWKDLIEQIAWDCRRGDRIYFWKDVWVSYDVCLLDKALKMLNKRLVNCKVKEMVNERGEWKLVFLKDYLCEQDLLRLRAIPVPSADVGDDVIRRKGTGSSSYIVADMYHGIKGNGGGVCDGIWRKIWKWKGPRRVQVLLWLCVHDRLLISQRVARLMGGSALCKRCQNDDESLLHALRNCSKARKVWEAVGGEARREGFYQAELKEWIGENLDKGKEWARLFAVTCWWQWHWRNKLLSEEGFFEPMSPEFVINKYRWEIESLGGKEGILGGRRREFIDVKWLGPPQGWLNLISMELLRGEQV